MFNKFMIVLLLSAAVPAMSFSMHQGSNAGPAAKVLSALSVTNPLPGAAFLSWTFDNPSVLYDYTVIDVAQNKVVRTGQTTQTSVTVKGLAPGTYTFTVTNGTEVLTVANFVIM